MPKPDSIKAAVAAVVTFLVSSGVLDVGQGQAVDGIVSGLLVVYAAVQLFRHPKAAV
ncbi:MAG TPA: hypothetical protein VFT50_09425 [Baekduia sp.]|nr:hypothetical protein [Baekduia sp.]